jgi:hypothetical protein
VRGVKTLGKMLDSERGAVRESGCLRVQPEKGGILHPRLNTDGRPIANKYREGKMKRTLKRGFEDLEIVGREAIGGSTGRQPGRGSPYKENQSSL